MIALGWAAGGAIATLASCGERETSPTAPPERSTFGNTAVQVTFGATADAALSLRDPRSGVSASIRLRGAKTVSAEATKDRLVYRAAAPGGGDVFVRPTEGRDGVEDFIVLDTEEAPHVLEYEVALGPLVAGVRLVGGTLELLDARGAPRLRMTPPYAIDRAKNLHPLDVTVEGCAVDINVTAPFGRAVTAPGARTCLLRLRWDGSGWTYPALVDPGWTTTGSLAARRYQHVSAILPNGNVLVAGGFVLDALGNEAASTTAEIYDVGTGTWATAMPMHGKRAIAAAATLANGDILVSGGETETLTILDSAEVYSATSGTWSTTGGLNIPRSGHTSTAVGDGTVLVAGGWDTTGNHFYDAELYQAGAFSLAGAINDTRFFHAAVALPGNRVLLGGGTEPFDGALGTLEMYTAGVGWAPRGSLARMASPRTLASALRLADGDVLFVGGYNATENELSSSERYRPSTNTWTTGTGHLERARYNSVPVLLPDGRALFIAGETVRRDFADGELYDPDTTNFTRVFGLASGRAFGFTANLLGDGRVLVAGGYETRPVRVHASSELFDLALTSDAGADDDDDAGSIDDAGPKAEAGGNAAANDASASSDAGSAVVPLDESPSDASLPRPNVADADAEARVVSAGGGCDCRSATAKSSSGVLSSWGAAFLGALAIFARRTRK